MVKKATDATAQTTKDGLEIPISKRSDKPPRLRIDLLGGVDPAILAPLVSSVL